MNVLAELPGVERLPSGKVRDRYTVGDALLLVASDRISAYDVVLPTAIPEKGRVLTALTDYWLDLLDVPNHRITTDVTRFPEVLQPAASLLRGRSMLCRRADVLPVECVARGFLAGSGWREYRELGAVCGIELPPGLVESQRLPEPIFTPATKAASGHDENIDFSTFSALVGPARAKQLRELTLRLYRDAAEHAAARGIILADTKFEFGLVDGALMIIDEVCTPDSSRFWPADEYRPGAAPPSFDKQYVRDWLDSSGWDRRPPAPALPPAVVERTRARYVQAYELLTGRSFEEWMADHAAGAHRRDAQGRDS